ncbi:MAG: GntR family transcriptional regulator [Devosiaceae bacterium]|nr:GntR family transcriptional regulator [Devosiaceae bacterium MH13]
MSKATYHLIADHLRGCFTSNAVPASTFINESSVATLLGTSRTPVRRALAELEEEGILQSNATRGFVFDPDGEGAQLIKLKPEHLRLDSWRAVDPLKPQSEKMVDRIERDIIRLALLGGWRLNAVQLGDAYSIGRNVAHEVLTKLEANGLVERRNMSRWTVPQIEDQRLMMMFDVRTWIEPNLLERAVPSVPQALISDAIDRHRQALETFPKVSGATLDGLEQLLHNDILDYAGNAAAMTALRTAKAGLISSKHLVASEDIPPEADEPFLVEHIGVLEAVQRRDAAEAKHRLQAHLLLSRSKVAQRIQRFVATSQFRPPTYATLIDPVTPSALVDPATQSS